MDFSALPEDAKKTFSVMEVFQMKYTVSEVAAMLGVNEETIRRDIRKGKLKASISSKKEGYTMENSARIAAYGQRFAEHADRRRKKPNIFGNGWNTMRAWQTITGSVCWSWRGSDAPLFLRRGIELLLYVSTTTSLKFRRFDVFV